MIVILDVRNYTTCPEKETITNLYINFYKFKCIIAILASNIAKVMQNQ